jgi:elongator complex protein 3
MGPSVVSLPMPFSAPLDPDFADMLLRALLESPEALSKGELQKLRNRLARDRGIARVPTDDTLLSRYRELVALGELPMDRRVVATLRRRGVRSLSGITVISLLAKPWACPGKCTYCPTYVRLPKSYVPGEPAVMRAERNGFDAMRQIRNRLAALDATGHTTGKCDVRIIGGTWSVYPSRYREEFTRDIYDAHTSYSTGDDAEIVRSATLEEAKTRNESAEHRVIGMAIETRPDWVTPEEIAILRRHGVTRVEIGYQTTIDRINELTKRGHGNAESIRATKLLKDA